MEYSNPFDHPEGLFMILQNRREQYSLWPAHCALPPGWKTILGPESQQACQHWLEANWHSLTPAELSTTASETPSCGE